jgi:hypothetical protein
MGHGVLRFITAGSMAAAQAATVVAWRCMLASRFRAPAPAYRWQRSAACVRAARPPGAAAAAAL